MAQAIIDCPECGALENYPPAGLCATHAAQTYPRVADEEVVIYYIKRRDACPVRDRLTPRMEARQIIDALDLARNAR